MARPGSARKKIGKKQKETRAQVALVPAMATSDVTVPTAGNGSLRPVLADGKDTARNALMQMKRRLPDTLRAYGDRLNPAVGHMMDRMGYSQGGLGPNGSGIESPIRAEKRARAHGLGFDPETGKKVQRARLDDPSFVYRGKLSDSAVQQPPVREVIEIGSSSGDSNVASPPELSVRPKHRTGRGSGTESDDDDSVIVLLGESVFSRTSIACSSGRAKPPRCQSWPGCVNINCKDWHPPPPCRFGTECRRSFCDAWHRELPLRSLEYSKDDEVKR